MIRSDISKQFPEWYKQLNPERHYLVMTNDFDSYYSCQFLMNRFKLKVGGYYDFESGLYLNEERTEGKQPIYVDLSISEGMTFDNHYTFIKNPLAINPNVNTNVYYKKYNGSTLALLYGLYNIDFSELDECHLTALLCIDGFYIGYYNKGGKYRDINLYWYDALGCKDSVVPILEKYDQKHFIDFNLAYSLDEGIYIDEEGCLYCATDAPLPKCKFELVQPVQKEFVSKYKAQTIHNADSHNILVSAETYINDYVINLRRIAS